MKPNPFIRFKRIRRLSRRWMLDSANENLPRSSDVLRHRVRKRSIEMYSRDTRGDKLPSCKLWKWNFQARVQPPESRRVHGVDVKVILKSVSLAQKSTRADGGNIFRYLLILECLLRILSLPLPDPSPFPPFSSFIRAVLRLRSYTYVRQHWKRFRSRTLELQDHRTNIKCQMCI